MSSYTIAGHVPEAIKIDYKKNFLKAFDPLLRLNKIAQRRKIGVAQNVGDTIEFTRFLQLPDVTSALTYEYSTPDESSLKAQILQATIDLWASYMEYSEKYKFTTIDKGMQEQSRLLGMQAASSFELDVSKVWAAGCGIPVRSDLAPAYEKHDVLVTTGTSATSITATELTEANDYWIGARGVFTEQTKRGYGEFFTVTDSTSAGVLTVTGLTSIPDAGQTFSLCLPTGLSSGNILTRTPIKRARKKLEWARAPKFSGDWYVGVLDPDTHDDLLQDELVEKLFTAHASGPKGLFDWTLGRVWGIDWQMGTKPYREAAGTPGTYSATGNVHAVGIFGTDCIGVVDPAGHGLKLTSTPPEVAAPKGHNFGYLIWKAYRQTVGLNPTSSVILLTGATS